MAGFQVSISGRFWVSTEADYLPGQDATDARSALAAFSSRWRHLAGYMLRGEVHPTIKIGSPHDAPELGDLLQRRAQILDDWVNDDGIW